GVALVTVLIRTAAPRWHLANLSMLYMLLILVTAVLAGRGPAIVAALLSFLALDWYFLHPVGHWTVSNPDEWVALMIFLVSSLVTEFALRSGQRDFGRMRVGRRADGWPLTSADRRLLNAFARHAAMAIDRGRLAHEAHEARLLRDSDALKTTLLSAVSHDLRTPLAGIKALTTTLLQEDVTLPPEIVRDALQGIDEETDRMTRLVGDLLDLSRIEAGVLRPTREPVLLPELIDDTLHRLNPTLAGREVGREIDGDLPLVPLDYVQMQQVLTN